MNQLRDLFGQWAAANKGNAGGGQAADPRAADWGGTRDALMKHDTARPGSPASLPGPGFAPQVPDFSSAFRAMGYGQGEGPGTHQVKTPEGPASQGKDVPGTGVPGPVEGAEAGAAGAEAGAAGGAAAGGAAELGELLPLLAL